MITSHYLDTSYSYCTFCASHLATRWYRNQNFGKWIDRGGLILWPSASPDLTLSDSLLWSFESFMIILTWHKLCAYSTLRQRYQSINETNSMEQSPFREANSYSASQEITRVLWNRIHKVLPLVCILNHMYSVHTIPTYSPNIHSNIILPSTPRSSKWSLSCRFLN